MAPNTLTDEDIVVTRMAEPAYAAAWDTDGTDADGTDQDGTDADGTDSSGDTDTTDSKGDQ